MAVPALRTAARPGSAVVKTGLSLDVRVLGDFEVRMDDQPVPQRNWQTRQVRKLFKYLLLERGRKVSREQLMEFLWPEAVATRAEAAATVASQHGAVAEPSGSRPPLLFKPILIMGMIWSDSLRRTWARSAGAPAQMNGTCPIPRLTMATS